MINLCFPYLCDSYYTKLHKIETQSYKKKLKINFCLRNGNAQLRHSSVGFIVGSSTASGIAI